MYDAKNQLSKLVALAEAGEEVVIAKNGRPAVRLEPVVALPPRELGTMRGLFIVPDGFDDTDTQIEEDFGV